MVLVEVRNSSATVNYPSNESVLEEWCRKDSPFVRPGVTSVCGSTTVLGPSNRCTCQVELRVCKSVVVAPRSVIRSWSLVSSRPFYLLCGTRTGPPRLIWVLPAVWGRYEVKEQIGSGPDPKPPLQTVRETGESGILQPPSGTSGVYRDKG